jgi:dipeptidyl aminopeptidase/acylaminoacyl peptidase
MEQRTLTPADRFRLEAIGDPQISPDGSLAAFVSQYQDLTENKPKSRICLADLATGEVRSLTAGPSDRAPRWSPDGARVAFLSDRSGKSQIHLISPTGGEARLLPTEQAPDSAPVWSPDGRSIAFAALVPEKPAGLRYKGAPAPKAEEEPSPRVVTRLDYHYDGKGFYGDKVSQIFTVGVPEEGAAAGPVQQWTTGPYNHKDPAWSPDSARLAFAARRVDGDEFNPRTDLYVVELATGELRPLCAPVGALGAPAWSPDGRQIACTGTWEASPRGVANLELWLVDAATGDLRSLTHHLDRPLGVYGASDLRYNGYGGNLFHWTRDGAACICLISDRGTCGLYRVEILTGKVDAVPGVTLPGVAAFDLAPDSTLVYTAGSLTRCDQLYALAPGARERQLTRSNAELLGDGAALGTAERFSYQAADGWPMDGWILYPPGAKAGQRHPAVLSVHGGPTGAYGDAFMFQFHLLAANGYAVIFTNPRGSQTYGEAFAAGCIADWGGRDFEDIMAGLDRAIALGAVDPNRVAITGWSYGGYMSCWAVTQTGRFKAAVAGANITNLVSLYGTSDIGVTYDERLLGGPLHENYQLYLERSAIMHVANVQTPMLLLHGESDIRCPVEQSEQFFTALRRLGQTAIFVRYPGEYHGLVKPRNVADRWERTLAWFDEYLA